MKVSFVAVLSRCSSCNIYIMRARAMCDLNGIIKSRNLRDKRYKYKKLTEIKKINKHKSSVNEKHFKQAHGYVKLLKGNPFRVLKKFQGKFDSLIYKMLFIKKLHMC